VGFDLLNLDYFGCSTKNVGGDVLGGFEYDGVVVVEEMLLLFKIEYDDILVENCMVDRGGVSADCFSVFFLNFFFFKYIKKRRINYIVWVGVSCTCKKNGLPWWETYVPLPC
jgi:hypothetical protein